ncbi:MAG: Multidrug export protein MepA [Alphaproteobacteria bacterium MarineAlpha5_Bin12]|nr:MATE family efflux transporter [Pelagibacteraceae bacterium]PPR41115.1 MAG: Multidrug export protein MepA [Alphaproteobacteria bacterium MarineAlpha5_Bin12]|tara:strand:+ start:12855 stop:14195 length:1341 start_codon:yes stop_codon:yes gene_type:complete
MDLTKENIIQLLKKVAIPASIGTVFQTLYNIVDTFFAGKISPEALSALAKSFPIYFIIIAVGIGLGVASTALMANSIGEGNKNKASMYLAQNIILTLIVAIIITFLGLNISSTILELMGSNQKNINLTLKYLDIIFYGSFIVFIQFAINSSLNAQGDTKSYRNVLIVSFFLNIFLNPLFIFGYGIFPAMGISGIAFATIFTQFLGTLYLIYKVYKTELKEFLKINCFIPKKEFIISLLKQAVPISFGMITISIGVFIILYFVGTFGEYAIAGYGTAIRFEQILLLPIFGLNTAVLSIAGQNFGAKNYSRVKETYYKALTIGCGFMVFGGILILLSSNYIVGLFTDNEDVILFGTSYLKVAALMGPVYPIFFITSALIQALKKAIFTMYINLLRMIILPLVTLWFVVNVLEGGFQSLFWGLFAINWTFGFLVLIFSHFFMKKIFKNG